MSASHTQNYPRLSVLTISLNQAKFLKDTINSVYDQQYDNLEYVLIDGQSSDGTQDILKTYDDIDWVSEPDGEYAFHSAFVKGLNRIYGDYVIQCCVSDGFLDKNWFRDGVEFLENHPECSLVWGLEQQLSEDGYLGAVTHSEYFDVPPPDGQTAFFSWLASGITFPESNYIVRADVLKKCWPNIESSPEHHLIQPHLGFIFNFHCANYKSKYIPRVVSWARVHENQRNKRLKSIEYPAALKYLKDIKRLRRGLFLGKSTIILIDNSEVTVLHLNFTKKVGLLFGVLYQKMRYSKFIIKPISSILIALVRRLKMYNNR